MTTKRGRIRLLSPSPSCDISGMVRIAFSLDTPGGTVKAEAAGFRGDGLSLLTAAEVKTGPDGRGSFLFPADEHPHGPMTLLLSTSGEEDRDVLHLSLFNLSGKPYREGVSSFADPPLAREKGLRLLFSDDFTDPCLSISRDRATRYYSHKPGGGDFSKFPFADFESPANPFSQRETWLRIRADESKNSTGLLSSIRADGTGFSAKAPCYFECRFLAPNATGTWPAFWLMTRPVFRGLHVPADELDVIEAYGLEDLSHQNQVGYYVTSHRWNQGRHETTDPGLFIDMRDKGSGLGWDQAFHTYGVLITEEETCYTLDDRPVFRHPTQPYSKTDPFFFMINLAVGGNGWPWDLSRCGVADMYVDFVRVYGL